MALISWPVRLQWLLPFLEYAEQSDFLDLLRLMVVSSPWFHFLLEDQFLGPGHSGCSSDGSHLSGSSPASSDFRYVQHMRGPLQVMDSSKVVSGC